MPFLAGNVVSANNKSGCKLSFAKLGGSTSAMAERQKPESFGVNESSTVENRGAMILFNQGSVDFGIP